MSKTNWKLTFRSPQTKWQFDKGTTSPSFSPSTREKNGRWEVICKTCSIHRERYRPIILKKDDCRHSMHGGTPHQWSPNVPVTMQLCFGEADGPIWKVPEPPKFRRARYRSSGSEYCEFWRRILFLWGKTEYHGYCVTSFPGPQKLIWFAVHDSTPFPTPPPDVIKLPRHLEFSLSSDCWFWRLDHQSKWPH